MAKKSVETVEMAADKAVEAPASGVAETPEVPAPVDIEKNPSGFCIYIGPNIKGLIQHGDIYRGNRADALQAAAAVIEKFPLVKTLIVSGDALPAARLKVRTPGNALHANYQKLAGK